jgi:hypothetical protein
MGQPILPSGDAAEIVFGPESKREGRQIPMSVFPANCDDVYQWKLARRDTACLCERRNDGPDVKIKLWHRKDRIFIKLYTMRKK